jgi:hypothetical protein
VRAGRSIRTGSGPAKLVGLGVTLLVRLVAFGSVDAPGQPILVANVGRRRDYRVRRRIGSGQRGEPIGGGSGQSVAGGVRRELPCHAPLTL